MKRDPGSVVVWIGCALLIVGTCVTMGLPHRRQWLRVTADGDRARVRMATADRAHAGRSRSFEELAGQLETALQRREGTV